MATSNQAKLLKRSRADMNDMQEFFKKHLSPTAIGVNVENLNLDEISLSSSSSSSPPPSPSKTNNKNMEQLLQEIEQLKLSCEQLSTENQKLKKENEHLKSNTLPESPDEAAIHAVDAATQTSHFEKGSSTEQQQQQQQLPPTSHSRPTSFETYSNILGLSGETIEECKQKRITLTCRRITEEKFPDRSDRLGPRSSKLTKRQTKAIRELAKILHSGEATTPDRLLTNAIDNVFASQTHLNKKKEKKKLSKKNK